MDDLHPRVIRHEIGRGVLVRGVVIGCVTSYDAALGAYGVMMRDGVVRHFPAAVVECKDASARAR